ncbi:MAG: hypothetical protein NWE91_00465 [Candidatus Bathyarchaeota archaeon]|nr:hypothetical protein [Candidatus Bathyarchaeota archaeon]
MSSAFIIDNNQIQKARFAKIWENSIQGWSVSVMEREQVIIPTNSLTEIQRGATETADLSHVAWELFPSKDPFSLSFTEFINLELNETEELLKRVYDSCKYLLEKAWKEGTQQVMICDGKIILRSKEIDGISSEDIERVAKEKDKACYAFSAPDVVEESVWTSIDNNDSYPTLQVYLGTEDSDDNEIVENSSPVYADLDTGNPYLKVFDANQLSEPLTKFSPLQMRSGVHLNRNYTYYNKRVKMCVKDINGNINSITCSVRFIRDWIGCALLQASPNRRGFIGRDMLRILNIRLKLDPLKKITQILDVSS